MLRSISAYLYWSGELLQIGSDVYKNHFLIDQSLLYSVLFHIWHTALLDFMYICDKQISCDLCMKLIWMKGKMGVFVSLGEHIAWNLIKAWIIMRNYWI